MLMQDLPWEYGKVVGKSVLAFKFETYDFLPGRMEIRWFVRRNTDHLNDSQQPKLLSPIITYKNDSSHDLLVVTLTMSSYISAGIDVMIERRFQAATFFPVLVEPYKYGEKVHLPWSKQEAAAVHYGRELVHWFLTWLAERWATQAQCNMSPEELERIEEKELFLPEHVQLVTLPISDLNPEKKEGNGTRHRKQSTNPLGLTGREEEIARLLAAGRTQPSIAAELDIKETTVETHANNIRGKIKQHVGIERDLERGETAKLLHDLGYATRRSH